MYRILVLTCVVSVVHSKLHIIGGNDIDIEDAPYQVNIYHAEKKRHHCGGSIVSPNYILTAAHCVRLELKVYRIRVGSSKNSEGGQYINFSAVIKHELYNYGHAMPYDIALVKVVPPMIINNKTTAIVELAEKGEKFTGKTGMVSGWGYTDEKDKIAENYKFPEQLQGLTVKVLSRETCKKYYRGIRDDYICAQHPDKNKDACQGDSGGPLVVDGKQVGIASYSRSGCAYYSGPAVYVEVAAFRDWIDEHLKF